MENPKMPPSLREIQTPSLRDIQTPSLREIQTWMRWIVTDPRGVDAALADPFPSDCVFHERYKSPDKSALPWIAPQNLKEKTKRLDVYAEAYFSRVLDSMKSDFPITARLLGEISFQKLISDYLKQHPSQTTNISEIGRSFSKFVADYADLKSAPFLESTIAMEWQFIESFYAKESSYLEPIKVASLTDEDWENTIFTLAPSVALLESNWPLDQLIRLQDESHNIELINLEKPCDEKGFLIFRYHGAVTIEALSKTKFSLITNLASGQSLIEALDQLQNKFPNATIGPEVMDWFNSWVLRGIICDLKNKRKE